VSARVTAILIVLLVILCFIGVARAATAIAINGDARTVVSVQQQGTGYKVTPKCTNGKTPSTTTTKNARTGEVVITIICPQ
jgi:hypothetical protein